jgi:hypothetical protein
MKPPERPNRTRLRTVTRNTVSWRVVDRDATQTGVLKEEDLLRISATYDIDARKLQDISLWLTNTFGSDLRLSQPELTSARKLAGQRKIARVNGIPPAETGGGRLTGWGRR